MYYDLVESGKRIKSLRMQRGLSQDSLSEIVGIHVKTVSKAERGIIGLSVDNLLMIAGYFDVSLDYLVKGKCDKRLDSKLNAMLESLSVEQQESIYEILKSILNFPK